MAKTAKTMTSGFGQYASKKFAALAGSLVVIGFIWYDYASMVKTNVALLEGPTEAALWACGLASAVYFLSQTLPDWAAAKKETNPTDPVDGGSNG